jgi:hypothetical protein
MPHVEDFSDQQNNGKSYASKSRDPCAILSAQGQRKVYDWYEKRYEKDEVVDIYSREWQCRIDEWKEWVAKSRTIHDWQHIDSKFDRWQTLDAVQRFKFALLFFAYPVATFSLWRVHRACYELDKAVCASSKPDRRKIDHWYEQEKEKPFVYLCAEKIPKRWEGVLKELATQISSDDYDLDMLQVRIYSIFRAVEKLQKRVRSLEENFMAQMDDATGTLLSETETGKIMLYCVRMAVDQRCSLITRLLHIEHKTSSEELASPTSGKSLFFLVRTCLTTRQTLSAVA